MATTAEQMRDWQGPALFSYGFRPFFLGAALWAVLAMTLWVPMLSGNFTLPTAFDPVSWHAHEFLFGYLAAVIAGFLLTAVPNWTGRLPIVGWPLVGLWSLWLAGRLVVALSADLPPVVVAIGDLGFLVVFAMAIGREIVRGRNWRNLIVLAMLTVFLFGNALFHLEAAGGEFAAGGHGLRIGLGASVLMIGVIGGRIVPSFTRNWLVQRGGGPLPVPPMQRFDKLALLALLAAILLWVVWPEAQVAGMALLLSGALHLARLARWAGYRTLAEPLVLVLHVGYAFVPLGAVAIGAEILRPGGLGAAAAQHLWMAGAVGLMTLAVMTRASLGHTGQTLTAGPGTVTIYAAMAGATLARVAAGCWPDLAPVLHCAAGLCWIVAFGGFSWLYGGALIRLNPGKRISRRSQPTQEQRT
jgi:uncharacterized protein involved in response to NO